MSNIKRRALEYVRTTPDYNILYKKYISLKIEMGVLLVLALAGLISGSLCASVAIIVFCGMSGFYIQRSINRHIAAFVELYESDLRHR